MAGCVDEANDGLPELEFVPVVQEHPYWRHSAADVQAELGRHLWHLLVRLGFVDVEDGLKAIGTMDEG